jgi:hypothetical protein
MEPFMFNRPLALTLLLLTSLVAACGADSSTVNFVPDDNDDTGSNGGRDSGGNRDDAGTGGTDTTTGSDTTVGADTTTGTDTTTGADTTVEPGEVQGGVTIYEVRAPDVDELNVGGVAAGFQPLSGPDPSGVVATVGACTISAVAPDSDPFPDEPTLDAGAIAVTVGAETFDLTIADAGAGPRYSAAGAAGRNEFFAGGQSVSFSADGGADVSAFSGSLVTPADPNVTSPDWEPLGDGHDRADDLTVTWGGASSGGDIIINILPIVVFPEPGIADGNSITCTVPDTGSAVIPAAALGYLPEGGGFSGGQDVALTLVRAVSAEVGLGSEVLVNATASHTLIGVVD